MEKQIFVKMAIGAWNSAVSQTDKLLGELSDEQLEREIAPGKNRGIYLLGHLAAVHDGMLALLDFGDPLFPHLRDVFIRTPDKEITDWPSTQELRQVWEKVSGQLTQHILALPQEEWFNRHTAVSEEDFKKEPHRNKLNVIINRTNHLNYHLGQLILLKQH
jgi:hypothetical protein